MTESTVSVQNKQDQCYRYKYSLMINDDIMKVLQFIYMYIYNDLHCKHNQINSKPT